MHSNEKLEFKLSMIHCRLRNGFKITFLQLRFVKSLNERGVFTQGPGPCVHMEDERRPMLKISILISFQILKRWATFAQIKGIFSKTKNC